MAGLDIPELIKQIADTDLGNTLMRVLKVTGLPTVAPAAELSGGLLGEYTPADNNISLNWRLGFPKNARNATIADLDKQNPELLTTLSHELTHAAVNGMSKIVYASDKKFPKDIANEFTKFSLTKAETPINELITKSGEDTYRASWGERLAFGVGNTIANITGNNPVRPVPHADATSATEFAIQADLFQRGIKQMMGGK
jgi:hypothetical protein